MTKIEKRYYQEECINSIVEHARKGVTKQVIVLATGAGKTICFGHLPPKVKAKGKKTLVLAHREELLTQAKDKMLKIDPTLNIDIEQGSNYADIENSDVIVASVPTIGRQGSKRIERFNPDDFGLVVIDECLSGDTLILTDKGEVPIKHIVEEQRECNVLVADVFGATKKYRVYNWFKHKPSSKQIRIDLKGKCKSLKITENHKVDVLDKLTGQHTVKKAGNIEVGDLVLKKMKHGYCPKITRIQFEYIKMLALMGGTFEELEDGRIRFWYYSGKVKQANIALNNLIDETIEGETCLYPSWELRRLMSEFSEKNRNKLDLDNEFSLFGAEAFLSLQAEYIEEAEALKIADWVDFNFSEKINDWLEPRLSIRGRLTESYSKELGCMEMYLAYHRVPLVVTSTFNIILQDYYIISELCPVPVTNIEEISLDYVYNISVENLHKYIANGVLVHNCHHATASTYKNVLKHFDVLKGNVRKPNGRILLGVTATPNRSDHVGLDEVFDKITYSYTIKQGISDGYLSNIKAYTINTQADISKVHIRMGDFVEKELAEAVDTPERNKLVVDSYLDICRDEKALVFAINVEHAENLTNYFKSAGVQVECVVGTTDKSKREQYLKDFSAGKIKVLVNVGVLTEGFDEPSIQAILMARPTKSSVIYSQIVGRGTRLHPDKDYLKLVDFVDNTGKNSVCSLPNLFGIPKGLKGVKGKLVTEILEKAQQVLDIFPEYDTSTIEDWSDENIEKIIKQVDIFAKAELPEVVKQNSNYAWEKYGEGYRINFPEDKEEGTKSRISIVPNMLDKYEVIAINYSKCTPTYENGYSTWKVEKEDSISVHESIEGALQGGDTWVLENKASFNALINQSAKWRKDSPSESQLKWLRKFNIPVPKGLSKGQASVLLNKAFANSKKK